MKRFILSVVLLLGFLFSSYTPIDPAVSYTNIGKDSATLEVTFQNPRVIVEDQRTSDIMATYFRDRDSLTQNVVDFLNGTTSLLEQDQERRYESALDYLSRKLSSSPENITYNIETFIKRKHILTISFGILFVILILYWKTTVVKVKVVAEYWATFGIILVYSVALYILYLSILRILVPYEYLFMKELLKLSSG